uniref:RNA polymerase-associated protein LEO1 n=2 Tax=Rhabditophanes sp. KR3021 TaxID=114890 RepID=A0AC35U8X0_9BILA
MSSTSDSSSDGSEVVSNAPAPLHSARESSESDSDSQMPYKAPSGSSSDESSSDDGPSTYNPAAQVPILPSTSTGGIDDDVFSTQDDGPDTPKQEIVDKVEVKVETSSDSSDDSEDEMAPRVEKQPYTGPTLHVDDSDDSKSEDDFEGKQVTEDIEIYRPYIGLQQTPLSHVKLPNFIKIEHKPFKRDKIEFEEDTKFDARAGHKILVENTIRWRHAGGNDETESNTKIVKWSDGSRSLRIGEKFFDITSGQASQLEHCFIRIGKGLHGQANFKDKLHFRSLERDIPVIIGKKAIQGKHVMILQESDISQNPEMEKANIRKVEEDRLRLVQKRENQQRRHRDRPRHSGINRNFIEKDGESLNAIKNRFKDNQRYSTSESSSEEDHKVSKVQIDSDDSEDDVPRKKKEIRKKKVIIDEED